jgi:hypothetical protein
MVILPPVDTSDPSFKEDISPLIKKVHQAIAAELGVAATN